MSVSSRIQSGQSASPYALSPQFIRQLRNFMNNWIVEGGSFRFDGYRTYLKVDKQAELRAAQWAIRKVNPTHVQLNGGVVHVFSNILGSSCYWTGHSPEFEVKGANQVFYLKLTLERNAGIQIDPVYVPDWSVTSMSFHQATAPLLEGGDISSLLNPDAVYNPLLDVKPDTGLEDEADEANTLRVEYIPLAWATFDPETQAIKAVGNITEGSLVYNAGSIPGGSGGGGEMPEGVEGDILYHDGTAWVTLSAPEAEDQALHFNIDDMAPEWKEPVRLNDFLIYTTNHTPAVIPMDFAMEGYNPDVDLNWSIEFKVSGSELNEIDLVSVPTNPLRRDLIGERYDGNAGADPAVLQTYIRIPIIVDGRRVCDGGVYRENLIQAGGRGPIVELVRIG